MATFEYTALSAAGRRVEGVLAGPNEQAVLIELESRQLTPVSITPRVEAGAGGVRVNTRKLGEAYGQLADLLRSGVPLLRSLKLLARPKSASPLATVFRELAEAVEKGSDLGVAMAERPRLFPTVHIAMVKAGEKGGFLEDVLARLGTLVVRQAELRSKVIGNLVYPAVLIVLGLGVSAVIFGVFVPQFRPIFAKIDGGLPLVTRLVFGVSDAIGKYGLWTLSVAAVAGVMLWRARTRPAVREKLVNWKTRAPIIGPLVRGFATARLCQLLGTMLSNGVPMIAALQITKEGTGNLLLEQAVERATEAVRAGQPLAPPLAESGLIDDDIIEMISVGESANNLGDVLVKIADTIESRLDRLLTTAVRLVEPLLLLMLASVVGIVAAALLLPMSKLSGGM